MNECPQCGRTRRQEDRCPSCGANFGDRKTRDERESDLRLVRFVYQRAQHAVDVGDEQGAARLYVLAERWLGQAGSGATVGGAPVEA